MGYAKLVLTAIGLVAAKSLTRRWVTTERRWLSLPARRRAERAQAFFVCTIAARGLNAGQLHRRLLPSIHNPHVLSDFLSCKSQTMESPHGHRTPELRIQHRSSSAFRPLSRKFGTRRHAVGISTQYSQRPHKRKQLQGTHPFMIENTQTDKRCNASLEPERALATSP
ncbi:hypothetical protein VUR80DRAFT_7150 [Thermomyces stellatus]